MTAHGAYTQVVRVHVCLTGLKGGVEMVGAVAGCSITAPFTRFLILLYCYLNALALVQMILSNIDGVVTCLHPSFPADGVAVTTPDSATLSVMLNGNETPTGHI
jgi:hypothetical protein